VPVLIVEAGDDRIVTPAARRLLRESLPRAEVLCLAGAGHALLQEPLIPRVIDWVSGHLPPGAPTLAPRPDQPGRTGG
jgi:alpha-beta hydrolase superfamily lysophospholipase